MSVLIEQWLFLFSKCLTYLWNKTNPFAFLYLSILFGSNKLATLSYNSTWRYILWRQCFLAWRKKEVGKQLTFTYSCWNSSRFSLPLGQSLRNPLYHCLSSCSLNSVLFTRSSITSGASLLFCFPIVPEEKQINAISTMAVVISNWIMSQAGVPSTSRVGTPSRLCDQRLLKSISFYLVF